MRRLLTLLAAAALLATSVAPVGAVAQPAQTAAEAAPDAKGDGASRGDNLEAVEVTPLDGPERGFKLMLGTGSEPRTYLIRLQDPAVPTYDGGKPGLAPTAPEGPARLDADSPSARAYSGHLEQAQVEFIQRLERTAGRDVEVPFTYQYAVNGLAAVLTPEEAREIANDPAVASIALDKERELHTDQGPVWSNADALWDAMGQLGLPENYKGEGIVIGTIDTGISPGNDSFADVGDDGYDHTNPLGEGNFLGVCNPDNPEEAGGFDPEFSCNDKLIGAYTFGGANPAGTAVDYDGHGSHTSSTSGGNVVNDVVVETSSITTRPFDISGVAPHANVISYLGCCTLSGLTAAIDQAIDDGVDVINYSIGSSDPSQLWSDFDTIGFLNARAAGIFVATSNGNDGPGFATTGSPSDAPWILSVGASTHSRFNGNSLTGLSSSEGTLPDLLGKGVTGPLGSTPIVYAGDVGDPLCQDTEGHEAEFTGKIVVCDRGVNGRIEKSSNVAAQGATGFVLANDEPNANSLTSDQFAVPGLIVTYADGLTLKAWLGSGTGHVASISGMDVVVNDVHGDIMASFSSRGPNRAIDVIVPDVTAPGVDILAAMGTDSYTSNVHGFISGTSMASPHAAGAGALIRQARPDWTPAQAQSALMTTARSTILNHDGTLADPYAQGSGHIDIGAAVQAGLLFDETFENYMAANPDEGGDPKTLNVPSFANSQCLATCSWERTATAPANAPAGVTWTASTSADAGLTLSVAMSQATMSPGNSMDITVTADVAGSPTGETLFGRVTLTPDNADVPTITMPVAVVPSSGVLPGSIDLETRRDAGSYLIEGIESIAVTDFTASVAGMVEATVVTGSLDQDANRDDAYDNLADVDVHLIEVPVGTTRLVAETFDTEMPDADLFVGTGSTPSADTEVCASTTPTAVEHCDVPNPEAGTWWVLVQNWEGSDAQPDAYKLATAAVPGTDRGNAGIVGPEGPVATGEPYDIRFFWDNPEMEAGDRWYGTAILGSNPATPGDIGSFPVTVRRVADDVTKTASEPVAFRGQTVSYEITVQPNVTPTDLVYTITDTVPDGLTIDTASVTEGGVVDGQTITWTVPVASPVGKVGDYVASTPATSQQCADWAGFLDLAQFGIGFASLDGDTAAANAFSNIGPFEHYGEQFPNLVVSEDGFVSVTDGYGGAPWFAQELPDPGLPNGVIAPLWSDLELSLANNRGMRLATAGDVAVIQWDDPFEFVGDGSAGPSVGKFQAWVYTTVEDFRPEMTFEYAALGALPGIATVGTESIDGDRATAIVNADDPSGALTAGGSVCLDYNGPSFDPITLTYDVTVDTDTNLGTLTNAVEHVTDDPFAKPAVTSAPIDVVEALGLTVSPDAATLKGKVGQTQQFTAEAALSNGGTLDVTGSATWTSGDLLVVTIDGTGLATTTGGGQTTVTAEFEGVSDQATVLVLGRPTNPGPPRPPGPPSPPPGP